MTTPDPLADQIKQMAERLVPILAKALADELLENLISGLGDEVQLMIPDVVRETLRQLGVAYQEINKTDNDIDDVMTSNEVSSSMQRLAINVPVPRDEIVPVEEVVRRVRVKETGDVIDGDVAVRVKFNADGTYSGRQAEGAGERLGKGVEASQTDESAGIGKIKKEVEDGGHGDGGWEASGAPGKGKGKM